METDEQPEEGKVTKSSVRYRPRPEHGREECGNCTMFQQTGGRLGECSLVAGAIDPDYVCQRWEPKR